MPFLPNILAQSSRLSDNDNTIFPLPLSNAAFTFDSLGVAGFFGGDSSVAGMATANLIPRRRWGGWYNSPGSYEIAKQYGPLGCLTLCNGLFPDGERDPARLFKLDDREGPPFVAVHSGSNFPHTDHLAQIITSKAEDWELSHEPFPGRRNTRCASVSIVHLRHAPAVQENPPPPKSFKALLSVFPILVSVGGCVLCALVADWFCFAGIAIGIVAHGATCFVIGSGELTFKHHKPAKNVPPGDGVLKGEKALVILVGEEIAVNAFTRGRFRLLYGGADSTSERTQKTKKISQPAKENGDCLSEDDSDFNERMGITENDMQADRNPSEMQAGDNDDSTRSQSGWIPPRSFIGYCSILLIAQFLSQLLLIPLGTLFGQLIFIATVIASWLYNTYLSTIDRDEIQAKILFDMLRLKPEEDIQKYKLSTWTATVAFTSFVLASVRPLNNPHVLLNAMIPNDTAVWRTWKRAMAKKLEDRRHFEKDESQNLTMLEFTQDDIDSVDGKLNNSDRGLLCTLFRDAENAWGAWCIVRTNPQMIALPRNQAEVETGSG